MSTLAILIPTYNRSTKLLRLLNVIEKEMTSDNNFSIEVLVSDNCSVDNTEKIARNFFTDKFKYKYYRQEKNTGFDGNVKFLYQNAQTDYVWFIADDDIPLPGSIFTIYQVLQYNTPDILLFPFIQPPDSTKTKIKSLYSSDMIKKVNNPKMIIETISKTWKISSYVLRKKEFNKEEEDELIPFFTSDFYFMDLCFSILKKSINPELCIISQPLATCDEDYIKFEFDSEKLIKMYRVYTHPFVTKHIPGFAESKKKYAYFVTVGALFSVKTKSLIVKNIDNYNKAIRNLPIRPLLLMKNPEVLLKFLLMKMHLTYIFLILKPIIRKMKKSFKKENRIIL